MISTDEWLDLRRALALLSYRSSEEVDYFQRKSQPYINYTDHVDQCGPLLLTILRLPGVAFASNGAERILQRQLAMMSRITNFHDDGLVKAATPDSSALPRENWYCPASETCTDF